MHQRVEDPEASQGEGERTDEWDPTEVAAADPLDADPGEGGSEEEGEGEESWSDPGSDDPPGEADTHSEAELDEDPGAEPTEPGARAGRP